MSNDPVGWRPRSADLHSTLRLAALAAVVVGVVLLTAAAFVLSYEGIHQIALRAGVSPGLAKLYPLIFDAMLVIAAAAALALRGASRWARCYAWASLLVVLVALAVGNAVYATGTALPAQPTKAAVAVTPWVLLLMAFGLLLEMLRHFRAARSTAAKATAAAVASGSAGADVNGGPRTAVTQAAVSGGQVRELPRVDLDTLLGPRAGEPPPMEVPHDTGAGENAVHQADPVSYGEETGYVHPDSYFGEGEYSPHGDTGGPEGLAELAGDGTYLARNGATAAEAPPAAAETPPAAAETPPAAAETPGTAETPPAAAETPGTAEPPAAAAEAPPAAAEAPPAAAETPPAAAETPVTAAETPDTSPLATATPVAAAAGQAAPGAANGQATGGERAGAKTPATSDGTAEAGQGGDGVTPGVAVAEAPTLERIRSTPTRPEE